MFKVLIRFIQKYLQTYYVSGGLVVCAQTSLFFNKPVPKKRGKVRVHIQLSFGGRLVSRIFEEFKQPTIVHSINQNSAAIWRIFSSNKSVPANKKKGFYTSRQPKNDGIGGVFVFSGELNSFKKFKIKMNKFKTYSG